MALSRTSQIRSVPKLSVRTSNRYASVRKSALLGPYSGLLLPPVRVLDPLAEADDENGEEEDEGEPHQLLSARGQAEKFNDGFSPDPLLTPRPSKVKLTAQKWAKAAGRVKAPLSSHVRHAPASLAGHGLACLNQSEGCAAVSSHIKYGNFWPREPTKQRAKFRLFMCPPHEGSMEFWRDSALQHC